MITCPYKVGPVITPSSNFQVSFPFSKQIFGNPFSLMGVPEEEGGTEF